MSNNARRNINTPTEMINYFSTFAGLARSNLSSSKKTRHGTSRISQLHQRKNLPGCQLSPFTSAWSGHPVFRVWVYCLEDEAMLSYAWLGLVIGKSGFFLKPRVGGWDVAKQPLIFMTWHIWDDHFMRESSSNCNRLFQVSIVRSFFLMSFFQGIFAAFGQKLPMNH